MPKRVAFQGLRKWVPPFHAAPAAVVRHARTAPPLTRASGVREIRYDPAEGPTVPHKPASAFPYPVVVGDIGGTNARFAAIDEPGAGLRMLARVRTADYPGVAEAILDVVAQEKVRPRSALLCGAGPVDGRQLTLTNAPWVMDGPALVARGVVQQGLLLNDFEAQALALPAIPDDFLQQIGPAPEPGPGPLVVLGPGTGLGIAALLVLDGQYVPVPSEACHIGFGPVEADEVAFWPHLEPVRGRVTSESVISGPGLVRVHCARAAAAGLPAPVLDGAAVVEKATADPSSEEAQTCRCFLRLVARFAGDIAITFLATGGVTLSGGILPRLAPMLDPAEFRRIFEAKAPVEWLPRSIGTRLVISDTAVLHGMAALAADPGRYRLDYDNRLWNS